MWEKAGGFTPTGGKGRARGLFCYGISVTFDHLGWLFLLRKLMYVVDRGCGAQASFSYLLRVYPPENTYSGPVSCTQASTRIPSQSSCATCRLSNATHWTAAGSEVQ